MSDRKDLAVKRWKPTRAECLAAANKTVPDLIKPGLTVLFCGINPGLYTAAIGRHFGRPGNRFWPALYDSGFTPRLYSPWESDALLDLGYGITNLVARATATADELTREELRAGTGPLVAKVKKYKPKFVAVVGVTSYRMAFDRKEAMVGLQEETIGETKIWVLPNPSGLNAHYTAPKLAKVFRELRVAAEGA